MPELPEVETIKNDLNQFIVGKTIRSVDIRKPKMVQPTLRQFQTKLTGQTIKSITRRAKMLVFELLDVYMLVHLKMSGQLIYQAGQKVLATGGPPASAFAQRLRAGHPIKDGGQNLPNKYSHVIFEFAGGSHLYFNDQRQFGWLKLTDTAGVQREMSKYGPEPLDRGFTLSKFNELLDQNARSKIKQFLMKQDKIAGIGNIYADEVCFLAGIRPTRVIRTLTKHERQKLYNSIRSILKLAIAKRGTSADKYVTGTGEPGGFLSYLKVYGRKGEPCKKCGTPITKIKLAQRGTHYCGECQK